jgi:transposase IS116/IS110/IS902 family protein
MSAMASRTTSCTKLAVKSECRAPRQCDPPGQVIRRVARCGDDQNLGALTHFTDTRALVAYVAFYPVISESGERAATPRLSPVGSRIARHALYLAAVNAVRRSAEWRTQEGARQASQAGPHRRRREASSYGLRDAQTSSAYNPSRLLVAPPTIGT